jgi:hypothetical protein
MKGFASNRRNRGRGVEAEYGRKQAAYNEIELRIVLMAKRFKCRREQGISAILHQHNHRVFLADDPDGDS